jgi:hypothetical protein
MTFLYRAQSFGESTSFAKHFVCYRKRYFNLAPVGTYRKPMKAFQLGSRAVDMTTL